MNSIIKKIDDLGRVAIPKEMRRQMHLSSFDELEIIYNNKEIVLKKHSPDFARELLEIKGNLIEWAENNEVDLSIDLLDKFADLISSIEDLTS